MDFIKKTIDNAIATIQLPIDICESKTISCISPVMEPIVLYLGQRGYHFTTSPLKSSLLDRPHITIKTLILVDCVCYNYYIVTSHVKSYSSKFGSLWKVVCKPSCYNEVMDIAHCYGYAKDKRYSQNDRFIDDLKIQIT